jgi:hypothetical protein
MSSKVGVQGTTASGHTSGDKTASNITPCCFASHNKSRSGNPNPSSGMLLRTDELRPRGTSGIDIHELSRKAYLQGATIADHVTTSGRHLNTHFNTDPDPSSWM